MLRIRAVFKLLFIFMFFISSLSYGIKIQAGVIDFEAKGISKQEASGITDIFRNELVASGKYSILERNNMESILKEQSFQMTGCTENTCAVKIGKLLNMEHMFYGSVMKLGGVFVIYIAQVKIETGEIVKTAKEKISSLETADDALMKMITVFTGIEKNTLSPKSDAASSLWTASYKSTSFMVDNKAKPIVFWSSLGGLAAAIGLNYLGYSVADGAEKYYNSNYMQRALPTTIAGYYTNYSFQIDLSTFLYISAYSLYAISTAGFVVWFFMPDKVLYARMFSPLENINARIAVDSIHFTYTYKF